jgi:hypothetical protein
MERTVPRVVPRSSPQVQNATPIHDDATATDHQMGSPEGWEWAGGVAKPLERTARKQLHRGNVVRPRI